MAAPKKSAPKSTKAKAGGEKKKRSAQGGLAKPVKPEELVAALAGTPADGWPWVRLLAVFATVFGSATSLGLGALQVAAGGEGAAGPAVSGKVPEPDSSIFRPGCTRLPRMRVPPRVEPFSPTVSPLPLHPGGSSPTRNQKAFPR